MPGEVLFEIGNVDFGAVKHTRGKRTVDIGSFEHLPEVLHFTGATRSD